MLDKGHYFHCLGSLSTRGAINGFFASKKFVTHGYVDVLMLGWGGGIGRGTRHNLAPQGVRVQIPSPAHFLSSHVVLKQDILSLIKVIL